MRVSSKYFRIVEIIDDRLFSREVTIGKHVYLKGVCNGK